MRGYAVAFLLCATASAVFVCASRRHAPSTAESDVIYYHADPECTIMAHRIAAKEAVFARLAAGEVTLAEAVQEYLVLNRAAPVLPDSHYDGLPGRSLGERIAGLLTFSVAHRMEGDPRRKQILDGMAREQAALVARENGEWLPDRPRSLRARDHFVSLKLPSPPP
jgi:hypothetical protein